MTIIYLGEMSIDSTDLADFLRGEGENTVWFFTSAYQVIEWAANPRDIVVLFEKAYANEAEELRRAHCATVELTPEMSDEEIVDALKAARLGAMPTPHPAV